MANYELVIPGLKTPILLAQAPAGMQLKPVGFPKPPPPAGSFPPALPVVAGHTVTLDWETDFPGTALPADNTTYSTLGTVTPGVAASSGFYTITVPGGGYVKVTLGGSAAITTATYY